MIQMEDTEQQFPNNSDFWINEIRGNVARLNDAAAIMETDIVLPTPTDHIVVTSQKIDTVRNFQFELRRLYKNSRQILDHNIDSKLNLWFRATSNKNNITKKSLLEEGLQLSNELQDFLFLKGVKDIDVADPELFPYGYYYNLLVNNDEETRN